MGNCTGCEQDLQVTSLLSSESPITNEIDKKQLAPVFNPQDHYFWIDGQFLTDIEQFKKRDILMYLLHVRASNTKFGNCSTVSYLKARSTMGLTYMAVDASNDFLILKRLLEKNSKKSIRVLNYPQSLGENSSRATIRRDMSFSIDGRIFIPSKIVDSGLLKDLSPLQLKVLLYLYKNCHWAECMGVDFQAVQAWNPKYKTGIREEKGKLSVAEPKGWVLHPQVKSLFGKGIYEVLNEFMGRKLFRLFPIVIKRDPDDPMIESVVRAIDSISVPHYTDGEIARDNNVYPIKPLEADCRVVWALMPCYAAKNDDYRTYLKRLDVQGICVECY